MAHSLEVRVPFLDHELLEFAARIPPEYKLRGMERKHVLRRAVRDLLPASFFDRRKMGFSAPLAVWFRDDLREFRPAMEEMLKTGEIRFVEVIASNYEGFGPGGLIEDLKLGFGALFQHHSAFKRVAVVSDKEWVAHTLHALAWMVPGELAIFGLDELERAKEWAAG